VPLHLRDRAACEQAISGMQVRGAPLIGAVAAFGLAYGLREDPGDIGLHHVFARLHATRPTAVNLRWALERVRDRVAPLPPALRAAAAWTEALTLCDEDVDCNRRIGEHGLALMRPLLERAAGQGRPLQLLTHCNAGALAAVAWGTALAPVHLAHQRGLPIHVWVDETRPRNQGASLTAWELGRAGVPHTVIADNAGGLLMMRGEVDAVIVGCDRVAANGDVANKVGTYLKALAARAHDVPFWVACPVSTLDPRTPDGDAIPIEYRSACELTHMTGRTDDGQMATVRLLPDGCAASNPAFDLTPAALVDALVTEHGPCAATPAAIAGLLARAGVRR
jgi:methylthioribose-1-phosphate isomerase